jgi:hypothetical protein
MMMFPISHRQISTAIALSAVVLAGCATMDVGSYAARSANLQQYRTYSFGPADTFSTGDPRLDNNTFFQEQIQQANEQGLAPRGFERRESGVSDLLVHYHASVTQQLDVTALDREYGYTDEDARPTVYDAGTLTIDLIDPATRRVVWRGWAEGSLDGVVDDQAWLEERVDEAVLRILRTLPSRL